MDIVGRALLRYFARAFLILLAIAPAIVVLRHPTPLSWLRPLCQDTWPILIMAALAAAPRFIFRSAGRYWSLFIIALTLSTFQEWCYRTGSHPALNPNVLWGILPQTDAHLYYTQACELLNGQRMSGFLGARQPYPIFLAVLLWVCGHDFVLVTSLGTVLVGIATWAAFEVIFYRLGWLGGVIYLACTLFYIRIYCIGVFMTEQLGILFSLCAVSLLIESLYRKNTEKVWLWCGGLFFLTQALNARPAAYMTLPFLTVAAWKLFSGDRKRRGQMVGLSAGTVAFSLLLHFLGDARSTGSPENASNVWFCIYGGLHDGNWLDGVRRARSLSGNPTRFGFLNNDEASKNAAEASYRLRNECIAEIKRNPRLLLRAEERALRFVWKENSPFRSAYPKMPSPWFTNIARWLAVAGLALSLILVTIGRKLAFAQSDQRLLGWVMLATVLGWITSLPFAPPWDGEPRILAATISLFYLLPAFSVSCLYQLGWSWYRKSASDLPANLPKGPVGSAVTLAGTLFLIVNLGPWCLIDSNARANGREHPVLKVMKQIVGKTPPKAIDLASLRSGYHLRLTDETEPTWLPAISRKDFVRNVPRGSYLFLAPRFQQVPVGSEVVTLPYWVLFVLDQADSRAGTFTPSPQETGRAVWPPVYFSKGIPLQEARVGAAKTAVSLDSAGRVK